MAIVKAICSIVRPGNSGKSEDIKPGTEFKSVGTELAELIRMKAVSVVSEDKAEAEEADEKPAKASKKAAAADKSDLV